MHYVICESYVSFVKNQVCCSIKTPGGKLVYHYVKVTASPPPPMEQEARLKVAASPASPVRTRAVVVRRMVEMAVVAGRGNGDLATDPM